MCYIDTKNIKGLKMKRLPEEDSLYELTFYERLLDKNPDYVEVLLLLSELYTKTGQHEKGLAADLKLTQLRPEDPIVHYNLACSYSLLYRPKEALEALERSINLGYRDFHFLQKDKDLQNLHQEPGYQALAKKYFSKFS